MQCIMFVAISRSSLASARTAEPHFACELLGLGLERQVMYYIISMVCVDVIDNFNTMSNA